MKNSSSYGFSKFSGHFKKNNRIGLMEIHFALGSLAGFSKFSKWSRMKGRSRGSQRCAERRRRWLESVGPRAQAGMLVGGEETGLVTAR